MPYCLRIDQSDETDMELAVRSLFSFSDVTKTSERIIIQVEEKWGDSTYVLDLQDRELSGNSILRLYGCNRLSVLLGQGQGGGHLTSY